MKKAKMSSRKFPFELGAPKSLPFGKKPEDEFEEIEV